MPKLINKKLCIKCDSFYSADRCPKCTKQDNKTYSKYIRAKDRQKIYNCKRWKDLRDFVRLRDSFLCQECLKNGIETEGKEVDHIIELEDDISLAYDADNLQLLCVPCHQKKTAKEREKRINS